MAAWPPVPSTVMLNASAEAIAGPRTTGRFADRETRPVVHGIGAFHRKAFQHPLIDHRLRAGAALFRRLEAEDQRAVERPCLRKAASRAEQHGHVSIVPAGVHKPRRNGRMIGPARLFNRQCVHICAKERALLPGVGGSRGAMQDAKDASLGDPFDDLVEPESPQAVGDDAEVRGSSYKSSGIPVEVASPLGQLLASWRRSNC